MKPILYARVIAFGVLVAATSYAQTATPEQKVAFYVNDEAILQSDFVPMNNVLTQRFNSLFRNKIPPLIKFDLVQNSLRQVILHKILEQDALQVGLDVTVEEAKQEFQKRQSASELNQEEFAKRLALFGITQTDLENIYRQQLRINRRVDQIKNDTEVSGEEREFFNSFKSNPIPRTSFGVIQEEEKHFEKLMQAVKAKGIIDEWENRLLNDARVLIPLDAGLALYNPVVARVAGIDIHLQDVNDKIYTGNQISGLYFDSDDVEMTIQKRWQPEFLQDLIDRVIANQIVIKSGKAFIGNGETLLEYVESYKLRDAVTTSQDALDYYKKHSFQYKRSAYAEVTAILFKNTKIANNFRNTLIQKKSDPFTVAKKFSGDIREIGESVEEDFNWETRKAIFIEPLTKIGSFRITRVLIDHGQVLLFIVNNLIPAGIIPFKTIEKGIIQYLTNQKRDQIKKTWLQAARKAYPVENHLVEVQKQINERLGIDPKQSTFLNPPEPIPPAPAIPKPPKP
jgi:SurA N-terminal domain